MIGRNLFNLWAQDYRFISAWNTATDHIILHIGVRFPFAGISRLGPTKSNIGHKA